MDKKRPVTIYLGESDWQELKRLARQDDRTLSYYMRQIIAEHLKRVGKRARTTPPQQKSESAGAR